MKFLAVFVLLTLVIGLVGGSHAQIGFNFPFGGGDYFFTFDDIHELYWQVAPQGENLITEVDYLEVRNTTSIDRDCTFYFMVDKTYHRLVIMHSEGFNATPSSFGKFLNESTIGTISDLLVVSDFGTAGQSSHSIFLCDEANGTIMELQYSVASHGDKSGESVTIVSSAKWSNLLTRPIRVESFDGAHFYIIDQESNSIKVIDSAGVLVNEMSVFDASAGRVSVQNIEVWKGWDDKYNMAVLGDHNGRKICVIQSLTSDFSQFNLVDEKIYNSGVPCIEYEPHTGLVVLRTDGNTDIYENTGMWTTGIPTAGSAGFGEVSTVKSLALERNMIYYVPTLAGYVGFTRGQYLESTSINWNEEELFVDLSPASLNYKINYPGVYRLEMFWSDVSGTHLSVVPGLDFSVGVHEPVIWLPTDDQEYYVKFQLINESVPSKATQYFETDFRQVFYGPRSEIVSPTALDRFDQSKPFSVQVDVEYGSGLVSQIGIVLEDEWGDEAVSQTFTDVSSGQLNCTLIAPTLGIGCGKGQVFTLRTILDFNGGVNESAPVDIVIRTKDCDPFDPPEPHDPFAGKTLIGGSDVFEVYFQNVEVEKANPAYVEIFDIRGRRVFDGPPGSIDGGGFNAGLYFIAIPHQRNVQKVLLIR